MQGVGQKESASYKRRLEEMPTKSSALKTRSRLLTQAASKVAMLSVVELNLLKITEFSQITRI